MSTTRAVADVTTRDRGGAEDEQEFELLQRHGERGDREQDLDAEMTTVTGERRHAAASDPVAEPSRSESSAAAVASGRRSMRSSRLAGRRCQQRS